MNVSVVIPLYNREKTIENAVRSVLNQTKQPMEIILVDDNSADKSVEIVRKMRRQNSKIRLLCLKKNSGAQVARNCGIKAAKGDWILFLDSDDELLDHTLEVQQEAVEKNPGYDVYYGDYLRNDHGRKYYVNCRMKGRDGDYFHNILFASKVLFQGVLVKKAALEDIGLLDPNVPSYQEWDTHIRLSLQHKYFYTHKPMFIYNIHDGETISKDFNRDIRGFKYIVRSNSSLFLKESGIESILFYYNGLYQRYNNDYRQYYFLFIKNLIQITSTNDMIERFYLRLFKYLWKDKRNN